MKAAVFNGIEDISIENVDEPKPKADEVLLKPAYCGICGSDLSAWKTGTYEPGVIIGHEFSAEVVAVGSKVRSLQQGDWVVSKSVVPCLHCDFCLEGKHTLCDNVKMPGISMNGGCAERVALPEAGLAKLLPGMNPKEAALVEPLAVVLHGFDKVGAFLGKTVLILGGGPIGLLATQVASLLGARHVVLAEPNPYRRAIAHTLGVSHVINPNETDVSRAMERELGNDVADLLVETSGVASVVSEAFSLVKKGGTILSLGIPTDIVESDFMSTVMNELVIKGSYCSFTEYSRAMDLINSGKVIVRDIITDIIPLDRIVEAGFKELLKPETPHAKILVQVENEGENN